MTETAASDPRPEEPAQAVASRHDLPLVAQQDRRGGTPLAVAVLAILAVVLFVWIDSGRRARQTHDLTAPVDVGGEIIAPATPLSLPGAEPPSPPAPPAPPTPASSPTGPSPGPLWGRPPVMPLPSPMTERSGDAAGRNNAPAVVIDFSDPRAAGASGPSISGPTMRGEPAPAAAAAAAEERGALRIGAEAPERARATQLADLTSTATQGTIIAGVLESALDSDLPGYARAIVSRDVYGFDGSRILIPRGSQLVGQYRGATSQGQSRAFVIWTRVIRPDGVSIQVASPGGDALGRAGLGGEVDRHFFERFGGSLLLSVINAAAARNGAPTQISIASPAAAVDAATQAGAGAELAPTIRVRQGAAIRIFVARDLDFSSAVSLE